MSPRVEFIFDFGSPNAYLAHLVIPGIEHRTGMKFEYVPVLLGGVFKLTGNVSPAVSLQGIKNKGAYQGIETRRFNEFHNITTFRPNPFFPVNTLTLMRGAIVAQRDGILPAYVDECFTHMWSEPKKMDDLDVIRDAFEGSDVPIEKILEGTQEPAIKKQLIDSTEAAVDRGVFGAPSFFVGEEHFFGKDRLRDVEEEIVAAKAR
jgi:2-hydroxychromene-2-carboxylate isomerase